MLHVKGDVEALGDPRWVPFWGVQGCAGVNVLFVGSGFAVGAWGHAGPECVMFAGIVRQGGTQAYTMQGRSTSMFLRRSVLFAAANIPPAPPVTRLCEHWAALLPGAGRSCSGYEGKIL